MEIAIIGNGLQSYVAAAVLASVGNNINLIIEKQIDQITTSEPGLITLLNQQQDANRLLIIDGTEDLENNVIYDFVILSGISPEKVIEKYNHYLNSSIKQLAHFIILTPSEIGEACSFSNKLETTYNKVSVCSVPLLLRQGRAINDFSRPVSIIIGCDNSESITPLKSLFYPFNRNKDVIKIVTTKEAEFSSFASLAMLATRLSFMNEMASLAERCHVDIDVIRECIGSDPRIGNDYLYPGCGYGGKKLSENVNKIANKLQLNSDDLGLLNIVEKINERQKDLLFRKIWKFFKSELKGKTISIWGVTFKPGSSSIEGAPAIQLIKSLLAQSAVVRVYDPVAAETLKQYFSKQSNDNLMILDSPYEAVKGSNVLAICTEWKEFWSPDLNYLKEHLINKAIFDGRNILEPKLMKTKSLFYYGVGRGEAI